MFFCTFVEAHKPYQSLMIIDIVRGKKKGPPPTINLVTKSPKLVMGNTK